MDTTVRQNSFSLLNPSHRPTALNGTRFPTFQELYILTRRNLHVPHSKDTPKPLGQRTKKLLSKSKSLGTDPTCFSSSCTSIAPRVKPSYSTTYTPKPPSKRLRRFESNNSTFAITISDVDVIVQKLQPILQSTIYTPKQPSILDRGDLTWAQLKSRATWKPGLTPPCIPECQQAACKPRTRLTASAVSTTQLDALPDEVTTQLDALPDEVLLSIFLQLPFREMFSSFVLVSKRWAHIGAIAKTSNKLTLAIRFEQYQSGYLEPLTLIGHEKWVTCLNVAPDQQSLHSGSMDRTIRVWSRSEDGSSCEHTQTLLGHKETVWALATSPCGRWLFSGSDDHTVRVWSLEDFSQKQCLTGHEESVMSLSVSVSDNGNVIYSGSHDATIRVWCGNVGAIECIATLFGHNSGVMSLALSKDQNFLFSGSRDATIKVWSTSDYSCVQTLKGHRKCVRTLAISCEGSLFSGSNDKTIRVWDDTTTLAPDLSHVDRSDHHGPNPETEKTPVFGHNYSYRHNNNQDVCSLAVIGSDNSVVSSSGSLLLVRGVGGDKNQLQTLGAHDKLILSVAVAEDGRVFSGSTDNSIRVW